MEKRNCPNCGAPIKEGVYHCSYCGTSFKREYSDVLVVERRNFPVVPLRTRVAVPRYAIECMTDGESQIANYTLKEMREQIAEALTGLIRIERTYDLERDVVVFEGSVRVIPPDFSF